MPQTKPIQSTVTGYTTDGQKKTMSVGPKSCRKKRHVKKELKKMGCVSFD